MKLKVMTMMIHLFPHNWKMAVRVIIPVISVAPMMMTQLFLFMIDKINLIHNPNTDSLFFSQILLEHYIIIAGYDNMHFDQIWHTFPLNIYDLSRHSTMYIQHTS